VLPRFRSGVGFSLGWRMCVPRDAGVVTVYWGEVLSRGGKMGVGGIGGISLRARRLVPNYPNYREYYYTVRGPRTA